MNEKSFALPIEKRQRILDAAYQVFSQSSYKGASMSEIASNAGISKALLFHYFINKKELYLFIQGCVQFFVGHIVSPPF